MARDIPSLTLCRMPLFSFVLFSVFHTAMKKLFWFSRSDIAAKEKVGAPERKGPFPVLSTPRHTLYRFLVPLKRPIKR